MSAVLELHLVGAVFISTGGGYDPLDLVPESLFSFSRGGMLLVGGGRSPVSLVVLLMLVVGVLVLVLVAIGSTVHHRWFVVSVCPSRGRVRVAMVPRLNVEDIAFLSDGSDPGGLEGTKTEKTDNKLEFHSTSIIIH